MTTKEANRLRKALFVTEEAYDAFKALCKEERRTYSQELLLLVQDYKGR